jgi:hypothetical protein
MEDFHDGLAYIIFRDVVDGYERENPEFDMTEDIEIVLKEYMGAISLTCFVA